jgi:peptidoglycan/LPS O-acetylase OafA/YrhL
MDARYSVLHSLNAARVCAEFLVVNFHVSLTPTSFLKNDKVAQALMSFFFVLSGFMAMCTNTSTDFSVGPAKMDYISRRFSKTYPTYLLWTLFDLLGTIVKHIHFARQCSLHWISLALQPVLLQAWLGCYHIGSSNPVGWYLCTLFWLWFLFPFIPIKKLFSSHPWTSVVCLYFVSVIGFLAFVGFTNMNTRTLPPLLVC